MSKIRLIPDWEIMNRIVLTFPNMRENLKYEFLNFVNTIERTLLSDELYHNINKLIICNDEEETKNFLSDKLCFDYWQIPVNDIWCRDYMPFNGIVNNKKCLIKTIYEPSYGYCTEIDNNVGLKATLKYENDRKIINIPIKLDGGNISTNGEYAIVSDKIFSENWNMTRDQILDLLENTFETKFVIIPSESLDIIGHADSIAVFLDETTILLPIYPDDFRIDNRYINEVYFTLTKNLPNTYKYIFLPCSLSDEISDENIFSAYGCFLNYFRIGNNLFIPTFEGLEREFGEIKTILNKHNFNLNIIPIPSDQLCKDGGILHCITSHFN